MTQRRRRMCGRIDRLAQTLKVLRLDAGSYRIGGAWGGAAAAHAEPFEVLRVALAELWLV